MLLTRWKMPPAPPPPPEPPSAVGALPPITLPLLAVRLCTASCRTTGGAETMWCIQQHAAEHRKALGSACMQSCATPAQGRTLLASMLLVLGLRECRPPPVPATFGSGARVSLTRHWHAGVAAKHAQRSLLPCQSRRPPTITTCPTLLTCCIAAAHHCGEPAIQPLAHAADQRARSEVAAQGQLLALSAGGERQQAKSVGCRLRPAPCAGCWQR